VRVVWAASYGGRQRGGFIPALESVARRLIARGDALDAVVPDVGPADWHAEVRALGAGLHVVPNAGWAAARRTAALRGDVVHVHFDDWAVPVTFATWPSRARLLWHLHTTFRQHGGALRVTRRRRLKYGGIGRRVAAFLCVTEEIAADVRALGAAPGKVVVVRNAVDGARFRPPEPGARAGVRARLAIDGPAIAFFGRDPALKGADVLAAALPQLPALTVVAVATPDETVAALARGARVVSVPFTDDVREVLWAVDAVALPSRGEGLPFVALEALACGVPVVASDLPWAVELARDEPGVRLARSGDPAALAAALRTALAAPAFEPRSHGGDLDAWAARVIALYDAGRTS
jgi:glycosyltransferase involved in cell wall biosynthesis